MLRSFDTRDEGIEFDDKFETVTVISFVVDGFRRIPHGLPRWRCSRWRWRQVG